MAEETINFMNLLLNNLELDRDLAWAYYEHMKMFLMDKGMVEPEFIIKEIVDSYGVIGTFYVMEEGNIYLSHRIFEMATDVGKLFYLTHEIVHFMDWHLHKDFRSEAETDALAKDILVVWGMM